MHKHENQTFCKQKGAGMHGLGYCTTRGYTNSQTSQLVDWTSRGLDSLHTSQLVHR